MRWKFCILFFRDWNHSNQYVIYDFMVIEHCLATNAIKLKPAFLAQLCCAREFINVFHRCANTFLTSHFTFSFNYMLCLIFFRILYFRSRFNFISGYALKVSLSSGFPIQPYSPFMQCANTFLSHCIIIWKKYTSGNYRPETIALLI